MAAGGIPNANTTHAKNVVDFAFHICQLLKKYETEKMSKNAPYFRVRIGIHTGPITAGVVGLKKFAYDIWGDAVNIAARMEANGEAGKINISASTFELVKDSYHCNYRGEIPVKGKGSMKMYFVDRPIV